MKAARTQKPYAYVAWPAWFYGPKGHAGIFDKPEDVPAGWVDHPSKVEAEKAPATETKPKRQTRRAGGTTRKPRAKKAAATPTPAPAPTKGNETVDL